MAGSAGAIVGLGFSDLSRQEIGTTRQLAVRAVCAAVEDAGMRLSGIDGLLVGRSPSAPYFDLPLSICDDLGLGDLGLISCVEGEGATAVQMLQQAIMALNAGLAKNIVCVFGDAPLKLTAPTGSAAFRRVMNQTGIQGWDASYGMFGAAGPHALAARRYMHLHGLSELDLASYAVSNRQWAQRNDRAFLREPLTVSDYLSSRYVVEPFRVPDCAYPVNGAVAIVVCGIEASADRPHPAVHVHGFGQGHRNQPGLHSVNRMTSSGGVIAGRNAYKMAGISASDVCIAEFYDAFSYMGILALEDYGICAPGEAPEFLRKKRGAPGGSVPINTGGGHLSGFYLQGMTPLSEAIIQARGAGKERQVVNNRIILVTGVGGIIDYHAAAVLSPMKVLS